MIINEVPYAEVLELRREVMYPDKNVEFVKLPDDDMGLHIGVYEKDILVSVMSIFLHGRDVQFRKLATKEEERGKGFASALMQWLIDYANDLKLDRLWCNARINTCDFYKKFGYVEIDECFSKNGYDYVVMERRFVD